MSFLRFRSRGAAARGAVLAAVFLLRASGFGGEGPEEAISGPLGLSEIIAIALKNDPELAQLRGNITIAEAMKRATRDWRDPELRFSRSWDNDVELERPYERLVRESSTDQIEGTRIDENGRRVEGGTVTRTESTRTKVTPGAERDLIREQTTQSERSTSTERTTPPNDPTGDGLEAITETQELQRDAFIEDFHGQDPLAHDDDYEFRLRFYPPNPWERAGLLKKAQGEINAARAELIAAEREVIIEVRKLYEELQYLKGAVALEHEAIGGETKYVENLRALVEANLITQDKVAMAEIGALTSGLALSQRTLEFENALGALAAYAGIRNPSRILVSDRVARPNLGLSSNELDYYIQMALASRGDLQEIVSLGQIAEGELAEVKGLAVPWLSFVDLSYGIDNRGGQRRSDNYGFQLGVTLPLFTWLGHRKEVSEAAISAYFSQMGAKKEQITNQVVNAYRAVQLGIAHKARVEATATEGMGQIDDELKNQAQAEDAAKLIFAVEKQKAAFAKSRLEAHRFYNQALILFEEALGTDIDAVFKLEGGGDGAGAGASLPSAVETEAASAPMNQEPGSPARESDKVVPMAIPKAIPAAAPAETPSKGGLFSRPSSRKRPGSRR